MLFDSNLSFDSHVSSICKTEIFNLKNISKLRPMLSMSNAEMLIHAFITSRLDYCNALLGGCSARLINKLQMVQTTDDDHCSQQIQFVSRSDGGSSPRDDLYNSECQWRPGHLDEPQRQISSEDLVT